MHESAARERLEAELSEAAAPVAKARAAAEAAERRARNAEAQLATMREEAAAAAAAPQEEHPELRRARADAAEASETAQRLRRHVAHLEADAQRAVADSAAQLAAAEAAAAEALAAERAAAAEAQRAAVADAAAAAAEAAALRARLQAARDEFVSWRERARNMMEAKDAELDAAKGRAPPRGLQPPRTAPRGLSLEIPRALSDSALATPQPPAAPVVAAVTAPSAPPAAAAASPEVPTASWLSVAPSTGADDDDSETLAPSPRGPPSRAPAMPPGSVGGFATPQPLSRNASFASSAGGSAAGGAAAGWTAEEVEYLKAIVAKFVGTRDWATQERLLPVLAALLRFTPAEAARLVKARAAAAPPPPPTGLAALFPIGTPFK